MCRCDGHVPYSLMTFHNGKSPPDRPTVLSDRLHGGVSRLSLDSQAEAACQQPCHNLLLKMHNFPRIMSDWEGEGRVPGRRGGGIRPGLDRSCNLLAGSWERASRHPHLFVRSMLSGRGTLLTHCFTFFYSIFILNPVES